jgi:hypothetical protein
VARSQANRTPAGDNPTQIKKPETIRKLIERGEAKIALTEAKALHKAIPSAETEGLVVDAYIARIRSFDPEMTAEALALAEVVEKRYSSARGRLKEIRPLLDARCGRLDSLVQPLADEATPPEVRLSIEKAVTEEVTDLAGLARCNRLPKQHPLRVAALAAAKAFKAVTRGLVEERELALSAISRRGPLAPWKPLIRAIARFYRGDDEGCEHLLGLVDPSSAPGRIVPTLRALISGADGGGSHAVSETLAARIGGSTPELKEAFMTLDLAFEEDGGRLPKAIRDAVRQCRKNRPELVEDLKQRIHVRAYAAEMPFHRVRSAMGGPSVHDARFWRLLARELEAEGNGVLACAVWEEFRRHAISQEWFPEGGPEEAVLYLRMASAMISVARETRARAQQYFARSFPGFTDYYKGQPKAVRALAPKSPPENYCLDPGELFHRAAARDPHSETFRPWLQWARGEPNWKPAEEAALAWNQALPEDQAPLLYLVESCEKRSALKKALGFLEKAERLDRLDPEVKRARLRLTIATAMRHVQNRSLRLMARDIEELDSLEQLRAGDRNALVPSLQWAAGSIGAAGETSTAYRSVVDVLGSETAANVFLLGLARRCGLEGRRVSALLTPPEAKEAGHVAKAVARGCALGNDIGIPAEIPEGWQEELIEDLEAGGSVVAPDELRTLAEAALRQENDGLAYLVSGRGLAYREPHTARFLLLRACSLPPWEGKRMETCLLAAITLARRQRDMALVAEAVEAGRQKAFLGMGYSSWEDRLDADSGTMDAEEIEDLLLRETEAREYPPWKDREPEMLGIEEPCDCPACRRRRKRGRDPGQFELFDDFTPELEDEDLVSFLDDEDDDDEGPWDDAYLSPEIAGLPPDVLETMFEIATKYPDGEIPPFEELQKQEPELVSRLMKAALQRQARGENPFGAPPPRPRKTRGKKKRGRRRP